MKTRRRPTINSSGDTATRRTQRRRARLVGLAILATLALSLASLTSPFSLIELRSFDYLSTFSPPPLPKDGPVIVAIDEPSMAEIGRQWPWPRGLHAQLIEALRGAGAKAIGVDVIFAEPSTAPENDVALAAATGPDVVLAGDETLITTPQADQFVRTEPLAQLTVRGARTGIASVHLSGDGTLRQVPPYADGFAARLAEAAGRPQQSWSGTALLQTFGTARTTVSYYQALDPGQFLPEGFFRDRIVIIGLSLQNAPTLQAGGADAFATPFTVHTGQLVAGAEIQATIFDNITSGLFIGKAGQPTVIAAIALAALLAAAVVFRSTGWVTAAFSVPILLFFIAASYALLQFGRVFVSPAGPMLSYLAIVAGQTAFDYAAERRSRRDITRAFSRYLSPALVERLANDPSQLKLGGERRTLTILFCDVRGFTTISEALKDDPEQLTALINRLLTPLSEIVLESGGTIDKYIGDCLMAFWNAPLDDPDHASHAVGAALRMLEAIETLNAELRQEAGAIGDEPRILRIGIGINTGDCVVGNMGSSRRFDYSVLGDSVNLASRLEGESKNYGVPLLIGERTAALSAADFTIAELDSITVKGRTTLSPIFTVLQSAPKEALEWHRHLIAAKYAGGLRKDDPAFEALESDLPQLSDYYRLLRSRLT
ncbi:adenylate/guanylate cyclase domain-containing protein [Pararhizobium sp. BT-229]|uniref:adenylate/guanylate cyclase domain-containing protein n=1 Tax=Pararhizobium sp. BT-229 TaxID=2986923 RepID=UPI0021F7E5BD|nr:adenylate/guanylate cyclase domain-containing protein [Pararhizobium sp. BT-229]MCV9962036.1 adenylate/guanylate cyclase domain-containing protein [Pararhizobium sp. BT-229]